MTIGIGLGNEILSLLNAIADRSMAHRILVKNSSHARSNLGNASPGGFRNIMCFGAIQYTQYKMRKKKEWEFLTKEIRTIFSPRPERTHGHKRIDPSRTPFVVQLRCGQGRGLTGHNCPRHGFELGRTRNQFLFRELFDDFCSFSLEIVRNGTQPFLFLNFSLIRVHDPRPIAPIVIQILIFFFCSRSLSFAYYKKK